MLANEAYTWEELAAAIRKAYREITEVYVLPKLINFTESIHPYLNDAFKTPGRHYISSSDCKKEHIFLQVQCCNTCFCIFQVLRASLTSDAFIFADEM